MNRSLQIVIFSTLYLTTVSYLPEATSTILYSFSMLIKELLLWMLPLIVTFFVAEAISSFKKKALLFIFSLFLFEAISNGLSIWYAYGCAHFASISSLKLPLPKGGIVPLFSFPFSRPQFWSADKGTFLGLTLGLISPFIPVKKGIHFGKKIVEKILTVAFGPLIPFFVLGFVAKMYKMEILTSLLLECGLLISILLPSLVLYISALFLLGGGRPSFFQRIQNLIPAAVVAFSSGCSLSTMPLTIAGTRKNLNNPDFADGVIPSTTNIQQVGDCILNGFFCFVIYTHFFGHPPSIKTWAVFSGVFILSRFATAAVLGGAIFMMLPIYEAYLNFSPEMIALILAFNVLLDPLVTASNVMANGAMCRIFERFWEKIQSKVFVEVRK